MLYHGYEGGTMTDQIGDDVNTHAVPPSSSFTAINQQPAQLLTPQSSASLPIQQNQSRRRAAGSGRRSHNPAVAQYLGLGSMDEPTHLEKYAPLPAVRESPPPKPVRKRRRLKVCDDFLGNSQTNTPESDMPDRQSISQSSRVTKPIRKPARSNPKAGVNANPQSQLLTATALETAIASDVLSHHADQVPEDVPRAYPAAPSALTASQETVSASPTGDLTLQRNDDSDSGVDDFDFDIDDEELLMLTSEVDKLYPDSTNSPVSSPQKTSNENDDISELKSSMANTSQRPSKPFVSPVTPTTRLLVAANDVGSAKAQKPIVRPPFPEPVRDRSPIIGLSSNTRLKTCFRIGEAINQSFQAAKSGYQIIIELYARVLASERTGSEQKFTFCDLFHAKPPYVTGMYTAAIWKPVQLFEYDGRRLLQEGQMCRCMGTMKRDGKEWRMTVLNIWEATWEDIEWVEGIVGA
ncbi:hypothetical protein Ptr902_11018 [Pyrenophora tritici-repentis]|nr:hypothetical protein Ptr902_13901 [Pyrenophora tritici-repentis]KAI2477393.1 hypothetical protein Ptr902_11018 [Pyrenophora tritici-repentis]